MVSTIEPGSVDEKLVFRVSADEDGQRLDRFLVARLPGATRRSLRVLLESDAVRVDGRRRTKGALLSQNECVEVSSKALVVPDRWTPEPNPDLDLMLLHTDPDLVVVCKPPGLSCHPLRPEERETVANAVVARFPEVATAGDRGREAGLVHRLDRPTSGVLVFARHRAAFRDLVTQIRGEGARKTYLALVEGDASRLPPKLDFPLIGRGRRVTALTGAANPGAQEATTWIEERHPGDDVTLVRVRIHAGRRHQIRAHLAAVGHPIVGDRYYGAASDPLGRPLLHAGKIELISPSRRDPMAIEAPLPADLEGLLGRLMTR